MKMLILGILLLLPGQKKMANYCTPEGSKTSVKCGGQYSACIQLHEDICGSEDPMPPCCAASPDSPDRTAQTCLCCMRKESSVTIPYDPL